jgi:hypothetical protein
MVRRRLAMLALLAGLGLSAGCSLGGSNSCSSSPRPGLFGRLHGNNNNECCGPDMNYGPVVSSGPVLPSAPGGVPYAPYAPPPGGSPNVLPFPGGTTIPPLATPLPADPTKNAKDGKTVSRFGTE